MKLTRILHHSVNVEGGLGEAAGFYRQLLALEELSRPEIPGVEGHWFGLADAQVHLVGAPAGPGPIRPTGPHVCFGVDDLDAAVAELEARGIDYTRGAQGSTVQIWIVDPSGNTIELQQDPAVNR
ncbi:MAG TPA: VOC family protein [Acidimicrobiales bacterium]|jgi:catechol 2,3-dioxygenase-like lactoylglutathione lyase family enzyme|nr:VOC family protein [Acidimicrobiales bacterium]